MAELSQYSADITAGSLLLTETKVVAGLLLDGHNFKEIGKLVETQNVLQKRSTAFRMIRPSSALPKISL